MALAALAVLVALGTSGHAAERKVHRVGLLGNTLGVAELCAPSPSHPAPRLFREGLRKLGWVEGETVEIRCASIEGDATRYQAALSSLIAGRVDVIVTYGNRAAHEASRATSTIPIVMATSGNPVEDGLAASLARPGANVTGLTLDSGENLYPKRLALLKSIAPRTRTVATLSWTQSAIPTRAGRHPIWDAAEGLGLVLLPVGIDSMRHLDHAIDAAVAEGAQALLVADEPPFHSPVNQRALHAAAERHRLPAVHAILSAVDSGGLAAYGTDIETNYRRAAYFVHRILKGEKPGDIPIEQPTDFELRLNLKAAKAIGLTLPQALLVQATRVIE